MKILSVLFLVVFFMFGGSMVVSAYNLTYDLGLGSEDIFFSKPIDQLAEGDQVGVYASIRNFGQEDVMAHVVFWQGSILIGQTQPISVRAGGLPDEVFVPFTVPKGSFNIRAEIKGFDPADENGSNNEAQTSIITPLTDDEVDGLQNNSDFDDGDDDDNVDDSDASSSPDLSKSEEDSLATNETESASVDNNGNQDNNQPTDEVEMDEESEDDEIDFDTEKIQPPVQLLSGDFITAMSIKAEQTGWKSYNFSFNTNLEDLDISVIDVDWDFGDGKTSKVNGHHVFPGFGKYNVKLTLNGPFGNSMYDIIKVKVSFFSIYNYLLWLGIGGVLIIMLVVWWLLSRKKNNKQENKKGDD